VSWDTMKTWAVALSIAVVALPGCVSSTKYRTVEDELVRTQDDLDATNASLAETEGLLVDANAEREMLKQRAALADQLAAEKAELERKLQEMADTGVLATPDGTNIIVQDGMYGYRAEGDVVFRSGSDQLTDEGKRILSGVATELKRHTDPIIVVGHTDSDPIVKTKDRWTRGNVELGANRAMTVREYLISQGVDEGRVGIESWGPWRPRVPGKGSAEKAKNRRVEVMVGSRTTGKAN